MAAEVAAGAVVAEEVVSTSIQGAAATYAVAKPTLPLKATFHQIATAPDDQTRSSLVRSNHSLSIVGSKAYIFGGETANGQIASNDIHSVTLSPSEKLDHEYALTPAVPDEQDGQIPAGRTRHAACAFNVCVAIFGGCDASGTHVDSDATIWLFNTAKSAWETLKAPNANIAPTQRTDAQLFDYDNNLLLYGGVDAHGHALKDVWHFSYSTNTWTPLPSAPVATPNAALAGRALHLISAADIMSSERHTLDLSDISASASNEWTTAAFPTNPLAPGPRARVGAGLVPVSTGYGRNYLLYFFGARQNASTGETAEPPGGEASGEKDDSASGPATQWGDVWTLQVASAAPQLKATTSLADAVKPARIKDAIRSTLGYDTGEHTWAEAEVLPPDDLGDGDGKVHPGPRAYFGTDVMKDGRSVVFWGGVNAKGEREGDGWVVRLS